MHSAVHKLC